MAPLVAFLLSLNLLELIHRASGVTIISSDKDVEVNEFDTATLPCDYVLERARDARLEWKRIAGEHISFVYFDGRIVENYRERATMQGQSIVLQRVTRADTATYRCEVTAKQDSKIFAEISFKLVVLVPPATPTCKVPSSAMSGSTVELVCKESEGSPPSVYTWYKDNVVLMDVSAKDSTANNVSYTLNRSAGTLRFNPVRKSNSGTYYCEAHNKVGRSERCSLKFMQISDLDVTAIVIAVVTITLVLLLCGLGLCYACRRGYLGKRRSAKSNAATRTNTPPAAEDFKHTKSFVI